MEHGVLGIDSNVLVRFLTRDDEEQFRQAADLFADAKDRSLLLSVIVLVEVNWTLRRVYRRARQDVLRTLEDVVHTRQFVIEDRDNVVRAIALARSTKADLSDALIALRNEAAGCERTATFDHEALHIEQMIQVGAVLE